MKIEEQVCSIEQMKELEQLGFDTSNASMAWLHLDNDDDDEWMVAIHNDDCYELSAQTCVPTFSIGDMLEMLSNKITNEDGDNMILFVNRLNNKWFVHYGFDGEDYCYEPYLVDNTSLITALVDELKLLKERNKI